MKMQSFFSCIHCGMKRAQSGIAFLYVIGGLVVLSAIASAVTVMTPSSTITGMQENGFAQAYYAAVSGITYAKSLKDASLSTLVGSTTDFTIGDTKFALIVKSKSGTTYPVQSIGTDVSAQTNYFIGSVDVTPVSGGSSDDPDIPDNPKVPHSAYYAQKIIFSGNSYTGNVVFKDYSMPNGGVVIDGSISYIPTGSSCLVLQGSRYGSQDGSSIICSNTCIKVEGNSNVYGTVNSQGDVSVDSGAVYGDIYSGGNVTVGCGNGGKGYVYGNIYAVGNVSVCNGSVTGKNSTLSKVNSGGNISIQAWNGRIYGDIYYYGSYSPNQDSGCLTGGTSHKLAAKPTAPSTCTGYTLPTITQKTVTKNDPSTVLAYNNTTYTIKGGTIDNKDWIFPSINITNGGYHLCFDLSTDGTYANVFVNGSFDLAGTVQIKSSSSGNCVEVSSYSVDDQKKFAKRIYMEVGGSTTFEQSAHNWVGTLYSQGNITSTSTVNVIGAFYSNGTINTSGGSSSYFVASDYANKTW